MTQAPYDIQYFQRYLKRGRISGRLQGDKRGSHAFWKGWLGRRLTPGARVIEIGCGLGFLARQLQTAYRYIGLDISLVALAYARQVNGVEVLVNARANALPFDSGSADAVIAFDVVEHLPEPGGFIREAARILHEGGVLVLSTPNTASLGVRMKRHGSDLKASMYTDESHVSLLSPNSWRTLVAENGFVITKTGTDTLWDIPYSRRLPVLIQKALLIPCNMLLTRWIGILPWSFGENVVITARKG